MRIWDLDPGFLNDKSLLGEHRELHGLFSIHLNQKKGYANHPETLRWKTSLTGLYLRHAILVQEMGLRGFNHKSALPPVAGKPIWPQKYIDSPQAQFERLKAKYQDKPQGRIPLPNNCQELWAFHKYSVMARDPHRYQHIGPKIAKKRIPFEALSLLLVECLRQPPPPGRLTNALEHMWGYVSDLSALAPKPLSLTDLMHEIREKAYAYDKTYLIHSTALGELGVWL